ncbi:MAG: MBL fold metallo-hydrolase [Phycisphaerales bacterium]|nr:MBL fold metallo-hydrolase [Phycisphaerales bacterium]
MVPRQAPRDGQIGFLYLPPIRVQGISVAGEQTAVGIPEYNIVFDIGLCPRPVLSAPILALSHTHMDHVAGLPYYFSQRFFQKLPTGKCYCPAVMAEPLRAMMRSWIALERQETPFEIVGMEPGDEVEVKPNTYLRAHASSHTIPSLAYALVERRKKLREEFIDLPQERVRQLRLAGDEISRVVEVPLVAYTGDTEPAPFLYHADFVNARVVITECTFFDLDHQDKAKIGKHLHVEDLRPLLAAWKAQYVVVVHASRRALLALAREKLNDVAGSRGADSVHMLMDFRANRKRLEAQAIEFDEVPTTEVSSGEITETS